MKLYVCLYLIAFVYQATCLPIGESLPSTIPDVPSSSQVNSVSIDEPKPVNSVVKSDAPVQDVSKQLPAVTEEIIKGVEEIGIGGIIKSVTEAKDDMQTPAEISPTERFQKNFEQHQIAMSSEAPKEANSQVNSVSIDEPKPVNSVVKSDAPVQDFPKQLPAVTEEIIKGVEEIGNAGVIKSITEANKMKVESGKEEVKSEKVTEEVKSNKSQEVKSDNLAVTQTEVMPSDEPKREEKPVLSEESSKGSSGSSEEKITSSERGIVSEEVRKESSEEKIVSTSGKRESGEEKESMAANLKPTEKAPEEPKKEQEKTEEKKIEKPEEKEEKKDQKKDLREESSVKPITEQIIESAKQSTVAISPVSPAIVSTATEKIKQYKRQADYEPYTIDESNVDCENPIVGCGNGKRQSLIDRIRARKQHIKEVIARIRGEDVVPPKAPTDDVPPQDPKDVVLPQDPKDVVPPKGKLYKRQADDYEPYTVYEPNVECDNPIVGCSGFRNHKHLSDIIREKKQHIKQIIARIRGEDIPPEGPTDDVPPQDQKDVVPPEASKVIVPAKRNKYE